MEIQTVSLKLFVREGCHLCDEAQDLLAASGVAVTLVDIEADLELEVRYGLRIPVLQAPSAATEAELDWPFDAQRLRSWLQSHGTNGK